MLNRNCPAENPPVAAAGRSEARHAARHALSRQQQAHSRQQAGTQQARSRHARTYSSSTQQQQACSPEPTLAAVLVGMDDLPLFHDWALGHPLHCELLAVGAACESGGDCAAGGQERPRIPRGKDVSPCPAGLAVAVILHPALLCQPFHRSVDEPGSSGLLAGEYATDDRAKERHDGFSEGGRESVIEAAGATCMRRSRASIKRRLDISISLNTCRLHFEEERAEAHFDQVLFAWGWAAARSDPAEAPPGIHVSCIRVPRRRSERGAGSRPALHQAQHHHMHGARVHTRNTGSRASAQAL